MNKKDFAELLLSVKQARDIMRGKLKPAPATPRPASQSIPAARIRAIRRKTKLSQSEFAALLQVPAATVRNWEQGRRKPQGPAQTLLRVTERDPQSLLSLLKTAS